MARIVKLVRTGLDYDLNSRFVTDSGNTYTTLAAGRLGCWVRMTDQQPTDKGPNSLVGYYFKNQTAVIANQTAKDDIGGLSNTYTLADGTTAPTSRLAAQFSDADSDGVGTASDDGRIQGGETTALFTTSLGFGNNASSAATDLPFSVAAWYRPEASMTASSVKQHVATGQGFHIAHVRNGLALRPQVKVFSGGGASSGVNFLYKTSGVDQAINHWYHIAFTYDGSGSTDGMKIYINGSEVSSYGGAGESGTYAGMDAPDGQESEAGDATTGTNHIALGGSHVGSSELDGKLSEFAFWKNHELSSDEVKAIYNGSFYYDPNARTGVTITTNPPTSGVSNNPPRSLIRDREFLEGAYPAALRGCNSDFMGKKFHPFDDLNSPTFISNYSEASVKFTSDTHEIGTFIGLTGSIGTHGFTFTNGAGKLGNASDFNFITSSIDGFYRVDLSGSSDTRKMAELFAYDVNASNMGVKATSTGNSVTLKHTTPNQGSFASGKLITTGNYYRFRMDPKDPFEIKQFSDTFGAQVKYPYSLPTTYQNIKNAASTPHTTASINTTGVSRAGLDTVTYTAKYAEESLKPFDDSRVHLDQTRFYNVGTPANVISGFSGPLKNKSVIKFDLNSRNNGGAGSPIFFATASQITGGGIVDGSDLKYKDLIGRTGSGMAYWCNTANQWEMLEPENVDTHHQSGSERIKACLGFAPSDGEERFNRRQVRKHVGAEGNPISQFGFPIAEQYNATGSQYIKMSDYIASPFLLEKAIIEIEGTFGFDGHAGAESQGYQKQFFMLNQMTDGDAPHYQKDFTLSHVTSSNSSTLSTETLTATRKGLRELIGYSKILFLREDHVTVPMLQSKKQGNNVSEDLYDALVLLPATSFTTPSTAAGITGSIRAEFIPSVAGQSTEAIQTLNLRQTDSDIDDNASYSLALTNNGGATLDGELSGRQIGSSFAAFPQISKGTNHNHTISFKSKARQQSPYLLFPEDRLVFGWQNRPYGPNSTDYVAQGDQEVNQERRIACRVVDRLSRVKVTIFGSHVLNNAEKHHGVNQLLTNNIVYEHVGADNSPVDQFDVSTLRMLSGSTSDALILGKMLDGTRKRYASVASGQQGTTGSLRRNIKYLHGSAFYKDSIPVDVFAKRKILQPSVIFTTDVVDSVSNSKQAIPIISPAAAKAAKLANGDNDTLSSFFGGSVSLALAAKNFLKLFDPETFQKMEEKVVDLPSTDPAQNGTKKTQMVDFAKNNYNAPPGGTGEDMSEGTMMMDALSANPTDYGSTEAPSTFGEDMNAPGDMPMGMFMGNASLADLPFEAMASNDEPVKNPFIVFISDDKSLVRLDGTQHRVNGSPLSNQKAPRAQGFLDSPYMRAQVQTCFVDPIKANKGLTFFEPAGFRYGFSHASPTPPEYYYSRTHYGHHSDMVHTPPETALVLPGDAIEPSVKVTFISRGGVRDVEPSTTNSQNLSLFATSSVPYADGLNVDRTSRQPDLDDLIEVAEGIQVTVD